MCVYENILITQLLKMRLRGIISLAQKKAQHFFSITRSLHTELNCCL